MLNRLDANIIDTYNLNSSFLYLGEEDTDKSTNGTPVPDKMKENGKRKGVIGKIAGIGANSNEPTRNGRRYPIELWRNVEKSEYFIEGMENRCIVGECNHPEERVDYSITEGAIVLTKYNVRDDGTVYTEFDILDTLPGRTLKTYFDAGCKVGVSSRGLGEEVVVNGETIIDPQTYQFYCFDAVLFPAVKSARMELIESASPKKQTMINSITKEIKNCKTLDECLFIENIAKETNLYLDEIKDCLNNHKEKLNDEKTEDFDPLKSDDKFRYMLLDRCKQDCDYFLNHDCYEGSLWGKSVEEHIKIMRDLLNSFLEKPDWISKEDIDKYEHDMLIGKYNKTKVSENICNKKITNEDNKIELSDKSTSDEDTTNKDNINNLQILMEINEQNDYLKDELRKRNELIKSLLSTSYALNVKMEENKNVFNKLFNSNKQLKIENENIKSSKIDQCKFDKIKSEYVNLKKINSELSSIIESLKNENNLLDEQNSSLNKKCKSLSESINKLTAKNKKSSNLTESFNQTIHESKQEIKKLNESIKSLQSLNNSLSQSKDDLINENNSLKESLNKANLTSIEKDKLVNQSLDQYIEMMCLKYNLKESTLRRRLGDNYSIHDITMIAEELADNISKINSLPFTNVAPERQIIHENIGLNNKKYYNDDISAELEMFNMGLKQSY